MMKNVKYVKAEDNVESLAAPDADPALDLYPLLGTWVNTNTATRSLAKVALEARGGRLVVRAFEVSESSLKELGETQAETVYATGISSRQAAAFTARYRNDLSEIHLMANLSLGLLVVAISAFTTVETRPEYFSREFFHREAIRN